MHQIQSYLFRRILHIGCGLLATVFAIGLALQPAEAASTKVAQYSKAPNAAKISVNLLALEKKAATQQTTLSVVARNAAVSTAGAGIVLDIVMNRLDSVVLQKLKLPGVVIRYASEKYKRVSAVISNPALLYQLANIAEVRSIQPEYGAVTRVGAVTSRADVALRSDIAKAAFSLDGTGQKIGILSDSFACAGNRDFNTLPAAGVAGTLTGSPSQDSGDLPATVELVRADASAGCTDEGAGMAELVHDIAPGAAIAFATVNPSKAAFATNITTLCSAPVNATVVVDDASYPNEPMYQDGLIAQAASACVVSGVPFYSAHGNDANNGFRQSFRDINVIDDQAIPPTGNDLHQWRTTTGTIRDGFIAVTLAAGDKLQVNLQWNQPFDSVSAGAGSQIDMDLFIAPTPDVAGLQAPLASSGNNQGTTGAPAGDAFETASYTNNTGIAKTVYVAVDHFAGSQTTIPQNAATPVELRLIFMSLPSTSSVQDITNGTSAFGGPTSFGHTMAAGVSAVAAVPWFDTAAFDPTLAPTGITDPESFSSRGGTLSIQFDTTGAFSTRTSFEPDISSVDGNNTRFFGSALNLGGAFGEPDSFPNFFGTSAAAPNAAAVAALIRQRNSALTPAQVNAALESTAIDITGSRASAGDDDVTGIGLIDANAAITSVLASADLAITNTDSPDPVVVGNNLTYTITVSNNGPTSPATGVILTDTLDASITFVSAIPSQGAACTHVGLTVTCNLGNITTGTPATVNIVITPNTAGAINNTASVAGSEPDPNAANNNAVQASVINALPAPAPAPAGGGGGCTIVPGTSFDPLLVILLLLSTLTLLRTTKPTAL